MTSFNPKQFLRGLCPNIATVGVRALLLNFGREGHRNIQTNTLIFLSHQKFEYLLCTHHLYRSAIIQLSKLKEISQLCEATIFFISEAKVFELSSYDSFSLNRYSFHFRFPLFFPLSLVYVGLVLAVFTLPFLSFCFFVFLFSCSALFLCSPYP